MSHSPSMAKEDGGGLSASVATTAASHAPPPRIARPLPFISARPAFLHLNLLIQAFVETIRTVPVGPPAAAFAPVGLSGGQRSASPAPPPPAGNGALTAASSPASSVHSASSAVSATSSTALAQAKALYLSIDQLEEGPSKEWYQSVRPSLAFQPTPLLCHAPHNSRSPLTRRRSAARPACWPTSRPSGPSILRRAPILPTAGARRSPTRSTRPCFVRPPQRLSFLLEPLLTYRSRSAYRSLWHADARYPRPAGDLRLGSPRSSQCRSGPALVGSRRRRVGAARQGASCSTFMAPVSRLCVLSSDLALARWPLPVLPRAPALRPGRIPRLVSVTRASTRPTSRFSLTLPPGIPSLTHTIDSTLQPCMSLVSPPLPLSECLSFLACDGASRAEKRGLR
jgi:hypothetical protein